MDYSIKDFRNNLILLLLTMVIFSCKSQNNTVNNALIYEIVFWDYFSNDNLDLIINDTTIIKNVLLSSEGSSGLTKVWVKIFYENGIYFYITSIDNSKRPITMNSQKQIFEVILNKKIKIFKIPVKKGRYLYFYNDKDEGVLLMQTKKQPILD